MTSDAPACDAQEVCIRSENRTTEPTVYPGKRYEEWDLVDPVEDTVDEARRIRDGVDARVLRLLEELAPRTS